MKKVLILCTGNSCRSQMAQACLQHLDAELCVRSAGTYPAPQLHPLAIEVMKEAGMPITDLQPHNVKEYSFHDPKLAKGSSDEHLSVFRKERPYH